MPPRAAPTTIDLPAIRQRSWTSRVSYTPTDLISHNIAVGVDGSDLSRCWEAHRNFHVLPSFAFFAVVDIMGKVTASMPEFLPGFQHHNHVHGEHYLESYRPFRAAAAASGGGGNMQNSKLFVSAKAPTVLASTARVLDIVDRGGKGVTVTVGITTYEEDDVDAERRKVCYNEWTSFVRGVPGSGASSSSSSTTTTSKPRDDSNDNNNSSINSPPTPDSRGSFVSARPDATASHTTTPTQSALYRAATSEWNPMHISPEHAAQGGFSVALLSSGGGGGGGGGKGSRNISIRGTPILSGSCTVGIGIRHVIDAFAAGDVARLKSARMRLSRPVVIGETVRTEMWFRSAQGLTGRDAFKTIVYRQVVGKKSGVVVRGDDDTGREEGRDGDVKVVISNAVIELWDRARDDVMEKL